MPVGWGRYVSSRQQLPSTYQPDTTIGKDGRVSGRQKGRRSEKGRRDTVCKKWEV